MNDYISRKAAINTANDMRKRCDTECIDDYHNLMVESLSVLPSADVVEVVTCRDCKHYDLAPNGFNGMCNRQYATFYADDYCSYGEAK